VKLITFAINLPGEADKYQRSLFVIADQGRDTDFALPKEE